ncbi:MAG: hypothetical protein WBL87_08790, partial [Methanothrix sp.]
LIFPMPFIVNAKWHGTQTCKGDNCIQRYMFKFFHPADLISLADNLLHPRSQAILSLSGP